MTAGYGDGRVRIGQSTVGRVAVVKVAAVPALRPRIRFELSWTLGHRHSWRVRRPQGRYQILDFVGELRVGADRREPAIGMFGVGDRDGHPPDFLQLVVKSSSLANWNGLSVSIPNLLATSGILRFARLFLGLETSVVTMRRPAGFTSA